MRLKILALLLFAVFIIAGVEAKPEVVVEQNGNIVNFRVAEDPLYKAEQFLNKLNKMSKKAKEKKIQETLQNTKETTPVLYIALADIIYETDKDEGAFWYSVGTLRTIEDLRMCKDESARQLLLNYYFIAPEASKHLTDVGKNKRTEILKKAVEWDTNNPERVSPKWACYHGIMAFEQEPEILPMTKYDKILKDTRKRFSKI